MHRRHHGTAAVAKGDSSAPDGTDVGGAADSGDVSNAAAQPVPVHRPRLFGAGYARDARLVLSPDLRPGPSALPLRRIQARAQPHRDAPRTGARHDLQRLQPAQRRIQILHNVVNLDHLCTSDQNWRIEIDCYNNINSE
jgi:hypothetical protein